jgi:hypothetical protein
VTRRRSVLVTLCALLAVASLFRNGAPPAIPVER